MWYGIVKKKKNFKSYKLKCYVYHVALAYDSFNSYFNYYYIESLRVEPKWEVKKKDSK